MKINKEKLGNAIMLSPLVVGFIIAIALWAVAAYKSVGLGGTIFAAVGGTVLVAVIIAIVSFGSWLSRQK